MIHLEIFETGQTVNFPESLAECDQREYIDMSKFIFLYTRGQINIYQFQKLSVYSLLNVELAKKELSIEAKAKIEGNVALLSDYVMNFFEIEEDPEEGKPPVMPIKLDFIHNPMPKVRIAKRTFVGPSDNFESVTFGQYIDGLNVYLDYEKFRDDASLVKLFKIFYQPKNKLSLKFFNPIFYNHIGEYYGFYLFFASFQKWLSSGAAVHYAGVEINLSIIFEKDSEGNVGAGIPGFGMKSLFHSVAESGIFGPAEKLKETPLWDVLPVLYEMRKKSLDEKAEIERIKSEKPQK